MAITIGGNMRDQAMQFKLNEINFYDLKRLARVTYGCQLELGLEADKGRVGMHVEIKQLDNDTYDWIESRILTDNDGETVFIHFDYQA